MDDTFRTAALRLLTRRDLNSPHRRDQEEAHLLPKALPTDLPFELPIPDNSTLVGSFVHGSHATIILDTPQTAEQLRDFYLGHFEPLGWTHWSIGDLMSHLPSRVPRPSLGEHLHLHLCGSSTGPAVSLRGRRTAAGITELKIQVDTEPDEGCMPERLRSENPFEGFERRRRLLEKLRPPRQAETFEGGGGGNDDSEHLSLELHTQLDLGAIAQHYTSELQRHGWNLRDRGQLGPIAWSTWESTHDGKERETLWFAAQIPDLPTRYFIYLQEGRVQTLDAREE